MLKYFIIIIINAHCLSIGHLLGNVSTAWIDGIAGEYSERSCANGKRAHYRYDALGRVNAMYYVDAGAGEWSDAWEPDVNIQYGDWGITMLNDESGMTSWEYGGSAGGEYFKEVSSGAFSIRYKYNAHGSVSSFQVNGEGGEHYFFDEEGRVVRVQSPIGETFYVYDPNSGRLDYKHLANGMVIDYTYEVEGVLLQGLSIMSPEGSTLVEYHYSYYVDGRLKEVHTLANGETRTINYTYDEGGRLVQVGDTHEARHVFYEYDLAGNRKRKRVSLGGSWVEDTRFIYNAQNQLIQAGDTLLSYDACGNVAERRKGTMRWVYTWDLENRLVEVIDYENEFEQKRVQFIYNGLGKRVKKIITDATVEPVQTHVTQYAQSEGREYIPLAWVQGADNTMSYFPASHCYERNGEYFFMLPGPQGVERVADSSGMIRSTIEYDSFGAVSDRVGDVQPLLGYRNEIFDEAIGCYFLRHRYYDPQLGIFLSMDPHPGFVTKPQTMNPYAYVHNDPINYRDGTGLTEELIVRTDNGFEAELELESGFELWITARSRVIDMGNRAELYNGSKVVIRELPVTLVTMLEATDKEIHRDEDIEVNPTGVQIHMELTTYFPVISLANGDTPTAAEQAMGVAQIEHIIKGFQEKYDMFGKHMIRPGKQWQEPGEELLVPDREGLDLIESQKNALIFIFNMLKTGVPNVNPDSTLAKKYPGCN